MEDEIVSAHTLFWTFGLLIAGCAIGLVSAFSPRLPTGAPYYALASALCILGSVYMISPGAVFLLLGLVALLLAWLVLFHYSEKRYERNYPVFAVAPVWTFNAGDDFLIRLHIASVRDMFIIGIKYDTEIDLTPMTRTTRWQDEFMTYADAKSELTRRARRYGLTGEIPDARH